MHTPLMGAKPTAVQADAETVRRPKAPVTANPARRRKVMTIVKAARTPGTRNPTLQRRDTTIAATIQVMPMARRY
jgi:hypothetical protein